jgi:uncharacterized protein YbcC (UPF0753/DUF2309 family)
MQQKHPTQPGLDDYHFDEAHLLHVLKHYLPTQGPLKDFIHHNPLHPFDHEKFFDAIFKASQIFGYKVTFTISEYRNLYKTKRITNKALERVIVDRMGEPEVAKWKDKLLNASYDWIINPRVGQLRSEWKEFYDIDLDNAVQPLLFRIICSYLDQGIAVWPFPFEDKGLIHAVRTLENSSFAGFFKTKRAHDLLNDDKVTIEDLLKILVGQEKFFDEYVYDQQFMHRGWSGMVSVVEDMPSSLMYPKKINLHDMIKLELLFEIDALTYRFDNNWKPLGDLTKRTPVDIFAKGKFTELHTVASLWQDAFEWSYYDTVLAGFNITLKKPALKVNSSPKNFQAIFCIDEREYSLRMYTEQVDNTCETFGAPGFFGVAFYFRPAHAKFYDKLAPAIASPTHLIREIEVDHLHTPGHEIMYTKKSHTLLRGYLFSYLLGIPALTKLIANLFFPSMGPAVADSFSHMNAEADLTVHYTGKRDRKLGLQIGFKYVEMANLVETLLRNMGFTKDFAPIVYIVGHGSSSANNPHHGAHDCGACSGRPGQVNARVFAAMANFKEVRKILASRKLIIPESTQFLGCSHDTASDEIRFFDEKILSPNNLLLHQKNVKTFESALDLNAKERSRRFVSINTAGNINKVRADIKKRSVSYFEPRPELGHGTNALCVVGSRDLTKQLFLDRRAFLQSYDYRQDLDGKLLLNVITPLAVVCGGINLEYYFSRMDNYMLGAGTKLPHNVMGLIGVANSSDGDLRTGLPLQMIEVHDPIRLLMIVEHYPEVVYKVISSNPDLYKWFINEWIHLVVIHPEEKTLYRFESGKFKPYTPFTKSVPEVLDVSNIIESSRLMETNHILDATREHIPVHILKL